MEAANTPPYAMRSAGYILPSIWYSHLVATSGSLLELYRQLCIAMGVESHSYSSACLTKTLREMLCDIAVNIQIPLLVIDEAHLREQISIPKGSVDVNCESPKSRRYICCHYFDYLFSANTLMMFSVIA